MEQDNDSNVRPVLTKQKDVATHTGLRGHTTNLYPRLGQKAIRKQSTSIRVVEHVLVVMYSIK